MRILFTILVVLLFSDNLVAQACNTPWNAGTVYASPTAVSHNGRNYTSKWWTQGNQPGSDPSGVWTDNGACSNCTLLPGTIGGAQSIPTNTIPSALTNATSATVSGGGAINYQWQKSTNNSSWTDISGATSATYAPGILTAKTYYRRKVSASGCSEAFTSSVAISIAVNNNLDTDDDGVLDKVDLDDDNDGILDCVENGFDQVNLANVFNVAGTANYASGSEIQLTPDLNSQAGSAMSYGKIDFNNDFNFNVEVYLGANDGGADGMAIVFHNDPDGINTVGAFGGGLGVSGIQNGIAIEFDTWNNGEVPEDHTQIKRTSNFSDLNTLTKLPNIEDSQWHLVNFKWNASSQTLSYSVDGNLITDYTNDLVTNIFNNESSVYLGFTAGTGGAKNEQKIRFPDAFCNYPMFKDTDGDGIVNSLDTDSDGDGCSDAIEGTATFVLSDITNEKLVGSVDANGIPVSATSSGQAIGASDDANAKDPICLLCTLDNDKDGVCDKDDLDDDNDGILDLIECPAGNFYWSTPPTINGKTATGKINTIDYTYTATVNLATTSGIYNHGVFPASYKVPNATTIQNTFISTNTIVFDQPVVNPTLVFASIGSGGQNVPIQFSNPVEVLFQSGPVTIQSPTQISGAEGFAILRMNGTFSQISFDYLADEGYVNFSFGADFTNNCDTDGDGIDNSLDVDSDGDGCADAIEGGAAFKNTDLSGQVLAGNVDANGVPVVATASGQTVGSSQNENVQDVECCIKPTVSTSDTKVCVGASITASPATGGTWTSSNTTAATISNAGVITGVSAGTATFTFTNTGGCSSTTNTVTVNAKPQVTLIDAEICADDPAATFDAGAGFASYAWSNNGSGNLQTTSGTNTGAYTVIVADANGCKDTASANLTLKINCGCVNDNDKDGVCDEDDLDDDNDGILDVVECMDNSASWDFETPVVGAGNNNQGTTFQGWTCTGGGWINLIHPPYGGAVPQTASSGNQYVEVGGTGDFSRVYTVASAGVVTVEIDFASWGNGTEQTQLKIFKADGTTLVAQSAVVTTPPPADWNNAWQNTARVSAHLEPGSYIIKFFLGNFQAFDNVKISSANVSNCDTDNDGIVNTLDTDSDGDGCADAVEGGASFKKTDLTNNALSGAVDANGVPVVAGAAGQSVGASANNLSVDVDCACTKPAAPTIDGSSTQAIHSFDFNAQQELNETTPVFANGKKYQYKVTGTWSVWSNDPTKNALDAAFRYADNSTGAPLGSPFANGYVKLDGNTFPRPDTNVYKANHEYWYSFTGQGQALNFTFTDSPYSDNHGSLQFTFYAPADTIEVCANNSTKTLSDYVSGTNLLWYTSATGSTGSATSPLIDNSVEAVHSYWVSQTVNSCESDRSPLYYKVMAKPAFDLGNDTVLCEGENMLLTAPAGNSYLWNTNETSNSITVSAAGDYSVEVTNQNGCKASDIINVQLKSCLINHIAKDTLTICKGDSLLIAATNVSTQVWSGTDVFRKINDSTIKVSPTGASALYKIGNESSYSRGTNAISNGDFEQGATGFTSQYALQNAGLNQGGYVVGTNAQNHNGVFSACGDHTSGSGKMFITDASTQANVKVWCQTISTVANTKYEFAAWVTSVYAPNPPILQFSVNGSALGNAFNVGATTCNWQEFAATWNSGATTSAEICLINQNTAGSGNDFAIDDITFSPVIPHSAGGDSVLVIVKDKPSIALGSNKNICEGDSVVLDAGVASTYQWNKGEITKNITVKTTGDYSVEITASNGCKAADTINVKVNTKPNVVLNNAVICEGDAAVTFDAGAGFSSYAWSDKGTGSNQTVSGKIAGNYTVQVADANGCKDTSSATLTVNAKPNVVLNNAVICQGDAAVTFDAGAGYSSYEWSENGSGNTQTFNGKTAGNYTVKVADAKGCKDTVTAALTVNAKPNVVLSNAVICEGDIAVTFDAGAGYSSYVWSDKGTGNSQTTSGSADGNYIVKVIDAKGCKDTATAVLKVNKKPTVQFSALLPICKDFPSFPLKGATPFGGIYEVENGTTWQQDSVFDVASKGNGNYNIRYTYQDANTCVNIAAVSLVVNDLPTLKIPDQEICEGEIADFDAGSSFKNYAWSTGSNLNKISTSKDGVYSITVTDFNGCKTRDTMVLKVNPLPIVELGDNQKVCDGEMVTLQSSTEGAGYLWNDGSSNKSLEVKTSGKYSLSITDTHSCVGKDEVEITVIQFPKVNLGSDQEICEGQVASLSLSDSKASYYWSTTEKESTIAVATTQSIILTQYNDVLCLVRDTVSIIVIPYPKSELGNDTTVCFTETLDGALTLDAGVLADRYLWDNGSTSSSISIDAKGTYAVSLTNGKSCTIEDQIVVNTLCKTSLFCPTAFTPNNDGTNDIFYVIGANVDKFQLLIFNRWGDVIFESNDMSYGWDGTVNDNKVQQDVYVVKIIYSVNGENGYQTKEQIISTLALIR